MYHIMWLFTISTFRLFDIMETEAAFAIICPQTTTYLLAYNKIRYMNKGWKKRVGR